MLICVTLIGVGNMLKKVIYLLIQY